jgi:hypothetical protein
MDALDETQICRYRRERGELVLDSYSRVFFDQPESHQAVLTRLIGDLLHACDLRGRFFADALCQAAVEKRSEVLAELEGALNCSATDVPDTQDRNHL